MNLSLPDGVLETARLIAQLDRCFLGGFVGGQQQEALAVLTRVFAGTPLEARLTESAAALSRNEFQEGHFVTVAAARHALQGALYDTLHTHVQAALGRPVETFPFTAALPTPAPMLEGARHWLMEVAINGFARLEANTVQAFVSTLAQMREQPEFISLTGLLTGFVNELLAALPIADANDVPLARWCDLWSAAMLNAVGVAETPPAETVSGTLYPLGIDLRQHPQMVSIVLYGVLENSGGARLVRRTWSSFKVDSIRAGEMWLLFPGAALMLECLSSSKAIDLSESALLPTGDLWWDESKAAGGAKFKLMQTAERFFGLNAQTPVSAPPISPLHRHPVQLAEPVMLSGYTLQDDCLILSDGTQIPLDTRRMAATDLPRTALDDTAALMGLLRYDAGQWMVQPLLAGTLTGKFEHVGQAGAKLLKKPPKTSTVSVLQERSSRLLRTTRVR